MDYTLDTILPLVRSAMDLNVDSTPLTSLVDVDTLALNDIIEDAFPRAARMVIETAPHYLLDRGQALATTSAGGTAISVKWATQIGTGWGWIQLPDDFLRLVSFQMSDWDYAVVTPITEDEPRYKQLKSRFGGITGNPQHPEVAIVHQPIGLTLEFYSCNSSASDIQVKRARYIPIPRWTNNVISIPEKLLNATIHQTCYLVSQAVGDDAAAARHLKITESMLS